MATGEFIRKVLTGLHIPPGLHLFFLLGLANLVSLLIGFLVGRERRRRRSRRSAPPGERDIATERRTHEFKNQIRALTDQNKRYRQFMLDIPHIIRRLNATVSKDDLTSAIVKLAGETLHTKTAHLYIFHRERDCLERVQAQGVASPDGEICAVGDGIVGRTARDASVKSADPGGDYVGFGADFEQESNSPEKNPELTLAAPIQTGKRLIGVLGVGSIVSPTGDEKNLLKMVAEIASATLVNRAFLGAARKEAITDPLTGLFNRRYFFEMAQEHAESAILEGKSLCVFLFDIDNFKNYNDNNGHDAGDDLLKGLSDFVVGNSRKTTVVARYGGEEFIVLLPETSREDSYTYADRLRELLAEFPFAHREKQPLGMVSISGGVSCFPTDGDSIQEVIRLADAALYRAKEGGRNRVLAHSSSLFLDSSDGEESE